MFCILSCTVYPAAKIPGQIGARGTGDLIIINLQKTPLDELATIRIFNKIDNVIELLSQKLEIQIPPFILHRFLKVERKNINARYDLLSLEGKNIFVFSKSLVQKFIVCFL